MKDLTPYYSIGNHLDEEVWHRKLASQVENGLIVELGVLEGYTTRIFIESSPIGTRVVGVDPIIPDSMNSNLIGSREKIEGLQNEFPNKFKHIFNYSWDVVDQFKDNSISYLFLDANHEYDAVKKDFDWYFPKIKSDGYIALHDAAMQLEGPQHWEGPSRLATELLNDTRVSWAATVYSMVVFRKN